VAVQGNVAGGSVSLMAAADLVVMAIGAHFICVRKIASRPTAARQQR
jgi:enoyl-CoA hydratase/carnithine racemase